MTDQQPMGHESIFTGDPSRVYHCVTDVVSRVRSGDYTSKPLVQHLAEGIGQANEMRPDGEKPVFAAAASGPATKEECCAALEKSLNETFPPAANEDPKRGLGNWWQIAQLLFKLAELIGKK